MEAMAYKKPVISTYHTGIPELVKEVLVNENDAEALSKALAGLLDDQALREEMGKKNREIIEKEYSLSINVDSLAAYFKGEKGAHEI
jgi:glycosyltransferase involved in cell wall biosynthesis